MSKSVEALDMPGKKVDIHIHAVGAGGQGDCCRLSAGFVSGPVFSSMLESLDIEAFEADHGMIEEVILDFVNSSEKIERSVLLSMDGVYKNSRLMEAETHLAASNDYVARIARENGRVLFGASVHPYRDKREMLREVDRCLDGGAVLFHWMPRIQQIDPEDDRCIPFYIRLAREGVPLLCHTGTDFAVMSADAKTVKTGSLKKMVKALDIGVKVIATGNAHADELMEMLSASEERKWDFYADVSCLFTPGRLFHPERIMTEIARSGFVADRIVYGSDFPFSHATREALVQAGGERSSRYEKCNPIDERYEAARDLGLPDSIFTNAWRVLRPLSR